MTENKIVSGLKEAVEHAKGNDTGARVTVLKTKEMAWDKLTLDQLIEEHKKECHFYATGSCRIRSCMKWIDLSTSTGPIDDIVEPFEFVGCLEYQTVNVLTAVSQR